MILLLSDGVLNKQHGSKGSAPPPPHSSRTGILHELIYQLDLRREDYILYFSDLVSAGICGKGSTIVGKASEASIKDAIRQNRVSAIIDAATEPFSELTDAAAAACRATGIKYVKCAGVEPVPGVRLCLFYEDIAAMIVRGRLPVIFYTEPNVARSLASLAGDNCAKRLYAPVRRAAVFDTAAALNYGIPLLNITERDNPEDADDICNFAKQINADMLICDGSINITGITAAGTALGVPVILTHRFGPGLLNVTATARDAVIAARVQNRQGE